MLSYDLRQSTCMTCGISERLVTLRQLAGVSERKSESSHCGWIQDRIPLALEEGKNRVHPPADTTVKRLVKWSHLESEAANWCYSSVAPGATGMFSRNVGVTAHSSYVCWKR
ncbi:hypothetical protein J6590_011558 [Homalodisca vitripennis]|nr:hypothetical protein J6590_011558 [Homalodisca vitripennis]